MWLVLENPYISNKAEFSAWFHGVFRRTENASVLWDVRGIWEGEAKGRLEEPGRRDHWLGFMLL